MSAPEERTPEESHELTLEEILEMKEAERQGSFSSVITNATLLSLGFLEGTGLYKTGLPELVGMMYAGVVFGAPLVAAGYTIASLHEGVPLREALKDASSWIRITILPSPTERHGGFFYDLLGFKLGSTLVNNYHLFEKLSTSLHNILPYVPF